MMNEYSRRFFEHLSEKEQRRFAGLEAHRVGWHGVQQVSAFYGLHPHTVRKGKDELTTVPISDDGRIRRPGGGRKKPEIKQPGLEAAFLHVLREHTAGSPMEAEVRWTHLGDREIRDRLRERGFTVGLAAVKRLLARHHYRRRQAVKKKEAKNVPERDAPFHEIAVVSEAEEESGNPLLSMDTKKKRSSGNCIEPGRSL
jgi:hypothetical protein